MPELNPYQSPKTPPENKLPIAAAKKAMGFLTMAILTPIAVLIAAGVSCLAVFPAVDVARKGTRHLGDASYTWMIVIGWAVFLIPPVIVLIAMGRWVIGAYNREAIEHNKKQKDTRL